MKLYKIQMFSLRYLSVRSLVLITWRKRADDERCDDDSARWRAWDDSASSPPIARCREFNFHRVVNVCHYPLAASCRQLHRAWRRKMSGRCCHSQQATVDCWTSPCDIWQWESYSVCLYCIHIYLADRLTSHIYLILQFYYYCNYYFYYCYLSYKVIILMK